MAVERSAPGWARWWVLVAPLGLLCGCGTSRLDEVVFHQDESFALKLVRYYERLLLHYDGEIYVVMCRDQTTSAEPRHETQDAGWRALGRGGAIGSARAADLLPAVQPQYQPTASGGLIIRGIVLRVSHQGCGPFVSWDPSRQADLEIDQVPKPDYCAPVGGGDCRFHDFFDERQPVYENISVKEEEIRFTVTSLAFNASHRIEVWSVDRGRSWHWQPAADPGSPQAGTAAQQPI